MRNRLRRTLLPILFAGLAAAASGCATNHLLRWSRGETSYYNRPDKASEPFAVPAGTVLAFPVALAWDVATFPFQWLWGTYPFGEVLSPENLPERGGG